MARNIMCLLFCNLLAVQPVFAQTEANQPPLPPGKPAGVHGAQFAQNGAIFAGALVIVLVAGIYAASRSYVVPGQSAVSASGTSP
jgi:hypothetical protein